METPNLQVVHYSQPPNLTAKVDHSIIQNVTNRGTGHRECYRHDNALDLYRSRLISTVHTEESEAAPVLTACCKSRRYIAIDAIRAMIKISVDHQPFQLVSIVREVRRSYHECK